MTLFFCYDSPSSPSSPAPLFPSFFADCLDMCVRHRRHIFGRMFMKTIYY